MKVPNSVTKKTFKSIQNQLKFKYPVSHKELRDLKMKFKIDISKNSKGVFIDGGAFDGCSVVKFKLANPDFDVISFEPNPILWRYFNKLPTTLIKKGISNDSRAREFKIDYIDADGSSLITTKKIIFDPKTDDSKVKSIKIDCVRLSQFLEDIYKKYEVVVLKLDVEGAEYEILEDLISKNLVSKLHLLYIEFHWQKCKYPEEKHNKLIAKLDKLVHYKEWDALEFAVHKRSKLIRFRRYLTIKKHLS